MTSAILELKTPQSCLECELSYSYEEKYPNFCPSCSIKLKPPEDNKEESC